MRRIPAATVIFSLLGLTVGLMVSGCTVNSAKKHYVLAEKLWSDEKYAAAVTEFEKVTAKDPKGRLGMQALYRAATTQAIFLSRYADAVRKYRTFIETQKELAASASANGNESGSSSYSDSALVWEAEKQIGDILFSKMEQHEQAIQHYQQLIKERPLVPEVPEFLFRIGKSRFFLWQFGKAVEKYRELIKEHSSSPWAEKAAYEIGVTYFTQGEQHPAPTNGGSGSASASGPGKEVYQQAIDAFSDFIQKYPNSKLVPEARFGIACCLEEKDQLDAAYQIYESLQTTYPSPKVIKIKLARLQERKAHRRR